MNDIVIILNKNHKPIFDETFLGINSENLQGNIIFKFEDTFVDGNAELEVVVGEQKGIIQGLVKENNSYRLPIKSSLLTSDHILMQLVIYEENTGVYKSEIIYLKVKESINATAIIPDEYPNWNETLNNLLYEIDVKVREANIAINQTNNLNITANKVDGDTTVTITKKTGVTQTVHILDGVQGEQGEQGETGVGITSIEKTSTSGLVDTYTITYSDGDTSTFTVTNGAQGEAGTDGRGIVSITKTSTSGLVDTYTITYTDNTTSTFTVTNGETPSDSGWIDMQLINSWTTYTQDYQKAQYRKIGNQVFLRGLIKSGTASTDFIQMPSGYRPLFINYLSVCDDAGGNVIKVSDDGYIRAYSYVGYISLTGTSYFVD